MPDADKIITMLGSNIFLVGQLGDCPNIEMPTAGGPMFWVDTKTLNGWRVQKNIFTNTARILDENDVRKAWGSLPVMEEKFKRLTRKEFLEPGDVIGISRRNAFNIYDHYAVYIGDDRVIHYAGAGNDFGGKIVIHEASVREFLKNDEDYFVLYFTGADDTPIKIQSATGFVLHDSMIINTLDFEDKSNYRLYSPDETVRRARSRIGEENYDLAFNNCEHFAIWCKTGISKSYQVKRVLNIIAGTIKTIENDKVSGELLT